ncbi:MAG: filamentous hemagglutinin N-terminal domain-containing protein, partial [Pseudomonadota bacterium]|nr:filamentous hemagglutinin N-terminal domain-containing protein [Pseudomonadota bacterium]
MSLKRVAAATLILHCHGITNSSAQIVTDGSLGPGGALVGPDFVIGEALGTRLGSNLFHSFADFNVQTGQSATFTSNFLGPTSNVISRVTGGNASVIDGLLRSDIVGADFWLINPNGLVFGENAVLDVPAGFHASTADLLELADGGEFRATDPNASSLTIAPPSAFGFLDATVGSIEVGGAQLTVGAGQSLSLVGGQQTLTNALLSAPSGRLDLAAVASAGSVAATAGAGEVLDHDDFSGFADIDLISSSIDVSTAGGMDGGAIGVVGQFVTLQSGSSLLAETSGTGAGGSIAVEADTGGLGLLQGSRVSVSSLSIAAGAGDAGQIAIDGGQVFVEDSEIFSRARSGAGGAIDIDANSVTALGGTIESESTDVAFSGTVDIQGSLTAALDGGVRAGDAVNVTGDSVSLFQGRIDAMNLNLAVNSLSMDGGSAMGGTSGTARLTLTGIDGGIADSVSLFDESFIAAETTMTARDISLGNDTSIGVAGAAILLNVDRLFLNSGGSIGVGSRDGIEGGSVLIRGATAEAAELVSIRGVSSSGGRSSIDTGAGVNPFIDDSTTGGPITIMASNLELTDEGRITSFASSLGSGGDILLEVDSLSLSGGALITSGTNAFGDAGNVTIRGASAAAAGLVEISGGDGVGIFTSSTFRDSGPGGPQGIAGSAGDISITAAELRLSSDQIGIPAIDASTVEGPGGSIVLAVDALSVSGGFIQASTSGPGDAGTISITGSDGGPADRIELNFLPSEITTSSFSTAENAGNAGAIDIAAREITLLQGSRISSSVSGGGAGGSIRIEVDDLSLSGTQSDISVGTTGSGDAGNIVIDGIDGAPVTTITASGESTGIRSDSSRIFGSPALLGASGSISIRTRSLALDDLARVSVLTAGRAGGAIDIGVETLSVAGGAAIDARTFETGDAGDITIHGVDGGRATSVMIAGVSNRPFAASLAARISSGSQGTGPDAGAAGNINISATTVTVADGANVNAETVDGLGGTITMDVGQLTVSGGAVVTTRVIGAGIGGSIAIDADDLILLDAGQLLADSSGTGSSGSVSITADELRLANGSALSVRSTGAGRAGSVFTDLGSLFMSGNSQIDATAASSLAGNVELNVSGIAFLQDSIISGLSADPDNDGGNFIIQQPEALVLQ